jgi:hypothetical protein
VLGFLCAGNEGFFAMLYLFHFYSGPMISLGPLSPIVDQLIGTQNGQIEAVKAFTFLFCAPVMFVKQFMNAVQFRQACIDIVEMDNKEREKKE